MLALVGEAYGGAGGIAQFNRDLFGALAADGDCRIEILPRHGGGHPLSPPAGVRQARPSKARLPFIVRAGLMAMRVKPDIIFCGHLFMAPLAAFLAKRCGAQLLIQVHGIEGWDRPGFAIRRAVVQADLVACVSRYTRTQLLEWAAVAPERVVVVSNTVSPDFTPSSRAAARVKWGLGDQRVLLTVGRLDKREQYKGQDRVIAALPLLLKEDPNLLYLVAGEGDDRPRLEALARQAGVSEQVRFLGAAAYADLPDLYRAADLFVLPSTGEGFGIVFLEAMACGLPALGLAAGGAVDALADGALGTAVKAEDLQTAMREMLAKTPQPGLPQAVQQRFGGPAMKARLDAMMRRLGEPRAEAGR